MTLRNFSAAQMDYMKARARFDVAHADYMDYEKLTDAECDKLGISTPYGILPVNHLMLAEAQRLLNCQNEARQQMYEAAHTLFDWATESALAKRGTPQEKKAVREMVATVKQEAYVERFFIELVDMCMHLAA